MAKKKHKEAGNSNSEQPLQQRLFDGAAAPDSNNRSSSTEPATLQFSSKKVSGESKEPRSISDNENQQILTSLLAFSALKGVGFKTICDAFDSGFLLDVWADERNKVAHPFLVGRDRTALAKLTEASKSEIEKAAKTQLEDLRRDNIAFVAKGHPSYPAALLKLKEPPRWLFVQGDKELLHSNSIVAVVGTREASDEGKSLAYEISACLAKQNVIVLSGLAKGIDEQAHKACVEHYGQTIAVLGHGISFYRISKNAQNLHDLIIHRNGAIISEYLPDDPPSKRSFLRRNELQVALSRAVIPIEFPSLNSGTGATVRRAESLQVPVIGFFHKREAGKPILDTKQNLTSVNAQINHAEGTMEDTIIKGLRDLLPNHDWYSGPQERQYRFFLPLSHRIIELNKWLDLDEASIERFAEMLKSKLRERTEQSDKGGDL